MDLKRRNFIKLSGAASVASCIPSIGKSTQLPPSTNRRPENVLGPIDGYGPHTGSLVSMMIWMRDLVMSGVQGISIYDLDYIHDEDSNSIGGMLLHLAAVDRWYQVNSFGSENACHPQSMKLDWSIPMNLGARGRNLIKKNPLSFYEDILSEVREHTFAEFGRRDDEWMLAVDESFGWGPTNNLCKWFHVCEHESNHNGQIKYIKKRIV